MAKLISFFVATLALQAVFGYLHEFDTIRDQTPSDVARMIEINTNEFLNLLTLHRGSNRLEDSINDFTQRLEMVLTKLRLKSNFGHDKVNLVVEELTTNLRKTLQLLQNSENSMERDFSRGLIEIFKSFEKLLELSQMQTTETEQFFKSISMEYSLALKHALNNLKGVQNFDLLNLHEEIENSIKEILHNLKYVKFNNIFVKRTLTDLVRDYINNLEKHLEETQISLRAMDSLKNLIVKKEMVSESELRHELTMSFEKLMMDIKKTTQKNILVYFLTTTRTLEFNIYTMCMTEIPHGDTSMSFNLQIRTISNALVNTLQTLSFENKQARQILLDQTHELIQNLESITEKLQQVRLNTVVMNLKQVIGTLKNMVNDIDVMRTEDIKMNLIATLHKATTEITKLLWIEDQEKAVTYGIFNDYLAILQHQLIQFQNIYQSTTDKQSNTHMGTQIQSITNSVILYLRNVPTNDVMIREKLEVQIHHLIKRVQNILKRVANIDDTKFRGIMEKIGQITESFEDYMGKTNISSIREVIFHFNILVQKVATEMKNLAWLAKHGHLEAVVKSILSEYLIIIENIQVKIQRINQVAQIGESPRELALQIEVVSRHLRKMLMAFVSDTPLSKRTLGWQIRHFDQVLEVITEQLLAKEVRESGKIYKKVALSLKNIRSELKEFLENENSVDMNQLRMKIGRIVVKVAEEIQHLCWISQADIQEGLGVQSTFIRSILLELLLSLQNIHIQMLHNYQVVSSGQSPTKILMEIQMLSKKLFKQMQLFRSSKDYKQIMTIQLGEYLQTIENILNSIHHEMKNNGEHDVEIEKIADVLGQMSLMLQNVNVEDDEFWTKMEMSLNEFVKGMHSLVVMNFEKVSKTQVGTHTGILHGMLSNMLSTLRNMYVQMQHTHEDTMELNVIGDKIASISNEIMPTLETIVGSTTPVKQALDVQIFKYTRNLKYLLNKFDRLMSVSKMDEEMMEIRIKLHQSLMVLQQTASSMTTLTINDLKLHFNKLVQGVGAEMQKLITLHPKNLEIRNILLHYLKMLKNVHIQIQNISRISHQSENYQLVAMQIDTAIIELQKFVQILPEDHVILGKVIVIESHEMAQLILNIINRYQAAAIVQKNQKFMDIATELKKIQLFLQDLTEEKVRGDIHKVVMKLVANMERAAVLIEQLMWLPVKTVHQAQYKPDMPTFVRVTLHDFLAGIQNMFVQIANVIVHVDDKGFQDIQNMMRRNMMNSNMMSMHMMMGDNLMLSGSSMRDLVYHPNMELYNEMMNKDRMDPKMNNLGMGNARMINENSWFYPRMHKMSPIIMSLMPSYVANSEKMRMMPSETTNEMNVPYHQHWSIEKLTPKRMSYLSEMMDNQETEPKQVIMGIRIMTQNIIDTLTSKPLTMDVVLNQVYQLINVLDDIVQKMQIEEIADNLHNLKLALENIVKRSSTMNLNQMKKEISENLETVYKQFEKVVMIHESRTATLVHNVLARYRNHLQMVWKELKHTTMIDRY